MELHYRAMTPPLSNKFSTTNKELIKKNSISWLAIVIPFARILCENVTLIIKVFSTKESGADTEAKNLLKV